MYQLNEKELLVKSSTYAVQREKLFIPICVYKKIAGKTSKRITRPYRPDRMV